MIDGAGEALWGVVLLWRLGPRPLGPSKGLFDWTKPPTAGGEMVLAWADPRKGHPPRPRTFSQQPRGVISAAVPSQLGQGARPNQLWRGRPLPAPHFAHWGLWASTSPASQIPSQLSAALSGRQSTLPGALWLHIAPGRWPHRTGFGQWHLTCWVFGIENVDGGLWWNRACQYEDCRF